MDILLYRTTIFNRVVRLFHMEHHCSMWPFPLLRSFARNAHSEERMHVLLFEIDYSTRNNFVPLLIQYFVQFQILCCIECPLHGKEWLFLIKRMFHIVLNEKLVSLKEILVFYAKQMKHMFEVKGTLVPETIYREHLF